MSVAAVVSAIAIPQTLVSLDFVRTAGAARYVASRVMLARALAVQRSAAVALRFESDSRGFRFATFQDGNHNGVRSIDIDVNIDRQIEAPVRLPDQFPGVDFGLNVDGQSGNPIQLGGTTLLTFTPAGTATSGSLYLRGHNGVQYAVRVLGATGRTRMQRYDERQHAWIDTF